MSVENSGPEPSIGFSWRELGPALITCAVSLLVIGIAIARSGGDPLALARLGTRFSQGDPNGTEGYDGQFIYYIAVEPSPPQVAPLLDVPAYRYQRILMPVLARALALGNPPGVAWALAAIGVAAHTLGTWAVTQLLMGYRATPWYALIYGLWVGLLLAVRLDLPEPLAYGMVAMALLADRRQKYAQAALFYGLALLAKETVIFFLLAYLIAIALQRNWRRLAAIALITLGPYSLFQAWLWQMFGRPGLGSGGAGATAFEWLPFAGFFRIAGVNAVIFLVFVFIFGPTVVALSIGGIYQFLSRARRSLPDLESLQYGFNALIIPFLPFSTIREPGGLLRFASGLLLAFLIYAAQNKQKRALNYAFFLLALNAFLIE